MAKKMIKQKKIVYVGPTLPGVAKEGTIYLNRMTPQLEEACRKLPEIEEFVIPLAEYEEVKRRIRDPQDALSQIYQDILKKMEVENGAI